MVVALHHTKKSDLATSLQILETVEVDVSGFAINMAAHPSSAAYGYPYVEAPHTRAQRRRSRRGSRKKRRQAAAAAS
jgi:Mrp family chromosome partitioning ATPase